MTCRYCDVNSDLKEMCVDCKRRYNRLSLNRSKLAKMWNSADAAVVTNKVLDDLAEYRALQERGCMVPPTVEYAMKQFEGTPRPGNVCGYCGESDKPGEPLVMRNGRQCEECYRFYNHFNVLYYGPKRPGAVKTRQTYTDMLVEIERRRDIGLKIPGIAARALKEEQHLLKKLKEATKAKEEAEDDSTVETRTERDVQSNPSIKRRQDAIYP